MQAYDENGERLETANILRRKFEALQMYEEEKKKTPEPLKQQFRPKRFKVIILHFFIKRKLYYFFLLSVMPLV